VVRLAFHPYATLRLHDLHVRTANQPPPQFPMASLWNGIVHHLSGPTQHASTQNPVQWTLGPVIPCRQHNLGLTFCFHRALWVDTRHLCVHCTSVLRHKTSAHSVDSLVRVPRRAESDAAKGNGCVCRNTHEPAGAKLTSAQSVLERSPCHQTLWQEDTNHTGVWAQRPANHQVKGMWCSCWGPVSSWLSERPGGLPNSDSGSAVWFFLWSPTEMPTHEQRPVLKGQC